MRIDITAEAIAKLNLRAPTGNEPGANEQFQMGGKTSGGVSEAVVNGIPKNGAGVSETFIINLPEVEVSTPTSTGTNQSTKPPPTVSRPSF